MMNQTNRELLEILLESSAANCLNHSLAELFGLRRNFPTTVPGIAEEIPAYAVSRPAACGT